jgi:parallel beta-helix repeat protein
MPIRFALLPLLPVLLLLSCVNPHQSPSPVPPTGHVYWVDGSSPAAADTNPGTEAKPWKTIARAGIAKELRPGDTVYIKTGLYREGVNITVSGQPGKPITFAAAPGAYVVVKGSRRISETDQNRWTLLSDQKDMKEPYPNAFKRVWRIHLGDEYFAAMPSKSDWCLTQVFLNDLTPLQMIGTDHFYPDSDCIRPIGKGLGDMIDNSFYYDPADKSLYVKVGGEPGWYGMEVGVQGYVLNIQNTHDIVVRGLDMRHNLHPCICNIGGCERVTVEDCRCRLSDFGGMGVCGSKNCTVRRCDLSFNGNTGLDLNTTENVTVEDCTLTFNNYRHFNPGWHCGGMKNIPNNRGSIIRRNEVAYTYDGPGIWFDGASHGFDNWDYQILDNVCHHNGGDGIFSEINQGGGIIANNLTYANAGHGIYVAGSAKVWVVNNTVADNVAGIVLMPRDGFPLQNDRVLNNLMIRNYIATDTLATGCDLTLFAYPPLQEEKNNPPLTQAQADNLSDFNVFADNHWTPTLRHHWNPNNTLADWQKKYGQDLHSRQMPVPFERTGLGFKLLSTQGLDFAAPLPPECKWRPSNPKRVGSTITQWP